ncbi:MAG: permease [Akkermansiaceae bacterium]|nr:permease [Akkermansiaceae bacterium]
MPTLLQTLEYFVLITLELLVLFMVISAIIELVLMHIPRETMQKKLSGRGLWGHVLAAGFGALTPFCACSTIPMTVGFLKAGVAFGATMSFLIASPLLNPIILGLLATMVGVKAMLIYFVLAFSCSVFGGWALEKIGAARWVRVEQAPQSPCCCGESHASTRPQKWGARISLAFDRAWASLRPVLPYLLIGVALGAGIYGYLPQDIVLQVAGADNPLAVPVAAVVGIPLYIRAETAIPIGVALMQKGMSMGAVIALVIGGAGMAIPEMSMLLGIFRKPLVALIVAVIFLTAVLSGYAFNAFLS